MSELLAEVKRGHYRAILADPPWTYQTYSDKGKDRSPEQHYSCMTLDEIKQLPVQDVAAKDSLLFLWTIDTHIPQALEVMRAWGFSFSTVAFNWVKTNRDGSPFTGMGHWTRANPELVLLGKRGSPKRKAADVRRLIMSPRREHSRKPDELHKMIQRLCDGPYLELFARSYRAGWTCCGNELAKFPDPELEGLL